VDTPRTQEGHLQVAKEWRTLHLILQGAGATHRYVRVAVVEPLMSARTTNLWYWAVGNGSVHLEGSVTESLEEQYQAADRHLDFPAEVRNSLL